MISDKYQLRGLRLKYYMKIQNLRDLEYHKWEDKKESIETTQELYLKKLREEQEKLNVANG